jgi:cytosine/adenosine deaminase-related metal-dependent hydrolase
MTTIQTSIFPKWLTSPFQGGRIESVGTAPTGVWDRVIDARGKLLLPGFFNSHYHAHETLLKGCFEAISLDLWTLSRCRKPTVSAALKSCGRSFSWEV